MEPIAIIGIGCRFPGAKNPEAFWQLLRNGVDAITEVPKERWDVDAFYDPEPGKPGKISTRWGGFLEQVDQFDPSFFGISPREVERMDPQQRLVLEVAWEAIENAGIAPEKLSGSKTGVFLGIGNYDYCRLLARDNTRVNAYDGTGNTLSISANRLSYTLNLRGPSLVVETACSSSLVALHYACRSLQMGESDLSLVGGASLMLSPEPFITYSHARMMASDGRCKTFDASADGYVRGEGCGIVVLKRLSDALEEGDNIQAVIKGSAVNQDGLSNGLTAPNGPSQQVVIREALQNAGVTPAQISYIEAHGTGTSLGDPIEFKALKAVLMQNRQDSQPCWLGSVKTNIGHLEAAAGIASIIKVALSLQHREIPPHLHLKQLNPYISLDDTSFAIPSQCQPWYGDRRLAGISAFGFGGTNCHVILEEAPIDSRLPTLKFEQGDTEQNPASDTASSSSLERLLHLLTLSAKTEPALKELAQSYRDFLATHPEDSLADICFTANTGRAHFEHRLAVVTESTEQLSEQLDAFSSGKPAIGLVNRSINSKKRPKVAFLFTGQGAQYIGMGHQLYETQPLFRQTIDQCDRLLRPYLEQPLLSVLYPNGTDSRLDQTAYTQPALFAVEYALAQLWRSWGVEPTIVMGHSVGEYVAACIAGVFSLEDGLKLIAERSRLMQALPPNGEMVAVFASETQVTAAIESYRQTAAAEIGIAAINGPNSVVISGVQQAIAAVSAILQAEGIKTKKLTVSHAFHSPLMEPMLAEFQKVAAKISYALPTIKLVSNVTGQIATAEIATPEYWCRHIQQPVRFAQSMETLHQQKYELFLEIGPKPTLLGMGRYCLPEGTGVWLPSLYPGRGDWQQILQSLATLYVQGVAVDWSRYDQAYPRHRLPLPTYPFQRQRYWAEFPQDGFAVSSNGNSHSTNGRSTNGHSTNGHSSLASSPLLNLLNQEKTQQIVQQLETAGNLSSEELQLLPKLLDLLIKPESSLPTTADWLYEVEWQAKPRQPVASERNGFHQSGSWLIFADRSGVGQALANQLRSQNQSCILVYPGDCYETLVYQTHQNSAHSIHPTRPADFDRLFQELATGDRPLKGVIHLWGAEAESTDALTPAALEQAQAIGVGSVLLLVQALVKHSPSAAAGLWLVTRGVVSVGQSLPAVAQASLWGLGKVIALEHPEYWGGLIDLAADTNLVSETESVSKTTADTAQKLLLEIEDAQGEDQLALHEQRYVARLVRKSLPASLDTALQPDGTYLITGGLGALGLKVAEWMVNRGASHLVLTGRRQISAETQASISQLEQAGATIHIAQVDVTQEAEVIHLFETIQASMPPLRGVIHAAGVLDDGILLQQNWERFTRVMAVKVKGTWTLHQLTQKLPLDFFVMFSSAAALLGSPGQGNYAAANAFMDAIAQRRRSMGLPGLSINWGPWGNAGMAASLSRQQQMRLAAQGMQTIAPKQGLQVLGQALGQAGQLGVLPIEWGTFKQQFSSGKQPPFLIDLLQEATLPTGSEAPQSTEQREFQQRLRQASTGERQTLLIAYLQEKVAKVLGLSTAHLDPEQPLHELGLDSLMAVELSSLIKTELQVELPIRALVEDPSIASIASHLVNELASGTAEANSSVNTTVNLLDLDAEASLDPAIHPANATLPAIAEPVSILLTGATGFLGAFLLQELLEQTQADIYCLVRSADLESGKVRLQKNLESYDLWDPRFSSRIIPVLGDLGQPQLGLSAEQFEQMAHQIDTIYHNGALLNYVYPYSRFKPINVLGTQEVLRLACHAKVKPVHHISSVAVFESSAYYGKHVTELDPVDRSEDIYLGYSQSKWVSEKLVQIAGQRGLPITIHRPPLVSGHSQTGLWNTDGFLCRMIQGCIQMGSIMADLDLMLDLSPVDYNSRAIVYLSRQKESFGKAFHLQNPNLLHWRDLVEFICALGYPMQQVSYEAWQEQLSHSRDNPLYPLLPFFRHKWSDDQLTYIELNEQAKRPQIGYELTQRALAGTSIECPALDSKLLATYFSYFIRSGFLEAPKAGIKVGG
ncbi:thioester reductase domain-containing protein [Phormidium tenue FACHB-886]|nr:thioester reductase domain-containing protein [Phormidium tenue FACHB-886]